MKHLRDENKTPAAGGLEPGRGASSSDARLVRAARRGDKQAFVEIVARHQAMVCGVALGIVGNIAASEDAAQEVFLIAWRKIHELREPETLRAWLRQIARHAALGYQRRQRGHGALEDAPDLPDLSPAPDEQAASEEEAALVRDALARLPETYREPLILYYRENQSTKAVAQALDISEDAVRQRLARGREMLRDQVSGVIESVLTRTKPTAIFTMTIAVAIGALASPAAVAGGAFATASGAASPGATPASVFKGLLASKAFLFVAAVATVACIPVGHHICARGELRQVGPSVVKEKVAPVQPKAPLSFGSSALFAEWKRLHDTYGTNIEAMPSIYREISRFDDSVRRRGFRAALIAEWVQLNPTNVMAGFRNGIIDASQRRQFIEEWLVLDAARAVEVFMKGGRGWDVIVRESLPELARRAPERVASVVARLPRPDKSNDAWVREAFAIVAERGIDSARAAAESLQGPYREQALAGVAETWGKRDLGGTIAWARKSPDGTDRDEIIRAALVGAAAADPVSALEQVNLVPPGGRKGFTTGARVLKGAANADFDATVGWVAAHPGRVSDEDLMALASIVGEKLNANSPGFLTQYAASGSLAAILPAITNALGKESSGQREAVWGWLAGRAEDSTTKQLKQYVLSTAGDQDTALAFRLAAGAPSSSEGDAQLRLLPDGLLRHGARLHCLDKLLEQAPPRLQQPLLESAFNYLRPETLADPQTWIERLSRLPDSIRLRGIESLARAWAAQMPEDAMGWAASMPAAEARAAAMAGIAATLAAPEPDP
jgi:RNA polymerase sigma factor (sigma-70 family)